MGVPSVYAESWHASCQEIVHAVSENLPTRTTCPRITLGAVWSDFACAGPQGPTLQGRAVCRYSAIVVSGTALILRTCAARKTPNMVKMIGGVVERIGRISKSRAACNCAP